MKRPVPKCLICRSGNEWKTASDGVGNDIVFAFSSLGKATQFCDRISEQRGCTDWQPYNMEGSEDLRVYLNGNAISGEWLVAIDAKGLADESFHVCKPANLIKAIEEGREEIEYFECVPRKAG